MDRDRVTFRIPLGIISLIKGSCMLIRYFILVFFFLFFLRCDKHLDVFPFFFVPLFILFLCLCFFYSPPPPLFILFCLLFLIAFQKESFLFRIIITVACQGNISEVNVCLLDLAAVVWPGFLIYMCLRCCLSTSLSPSLDVYLLSCLFPFFIYVFRWTLILLSFLFSFFSLLRLIFSLLRLFSLFLRPISLLLLVFPRLFSLFFLLPRLFPLLLLLFSLSTSYLFRLFYESRKEAKNLS